MWTFQKSSQGYHKTYKTTLNWVFQTVPLVTFKRSLLLSHKTARTLLLPDAKPTTSSLLLMAAYW